MIEILARLGWFAVTSVAVAYVTFLIAGGIVNAQASGANDPILIRDELEAGAHQLSGMVMVPTACDELSVKTQKLSATNYALVFTTWREPSVNCTKDSTPRTFHTTLFAPATGVYFVATLDDVALPIAVLPILNGTTY